MLVLIYSTFRDTTHNLLPSHFETLKCLRIKSQAKVTLLTHLLYIISALAIVHSFTLSLQQDSIYP